MGSFGSVLTCAQQAFGCGASTLESTELIFMGIHESPGHVKRGVSLSPLCKLPRACVEGRSKGGNTGLPRWSLFSVLNRYLVETLIGALSTPIPRPKLKHGQKDDLTMRAGECGGKDYYFYDTNR